MCHLSWHLSQPQLTGGQFIDHMPCECKMLSNVISVVISWLYMTTMKGD